MNAFDEIQEEVKRLADELTPELLPQVLERLMMRDGLVACQRHAMLLGPYVQAQIMLTRAKRNDWHFATPTSQHIMQHWLEVRNERRARYRSTPCTCWVPKR